MKVSKIVSMILGLVIAFLAGYDKISENISDLTKTTGIPIMLLLKIIGIILLLYWITYFLLKKSQKTSKIKVKLNKKVKFKIEKPVVLPPEVELLKILNLIDEKKSITRDSLTSKLKYSDKTAKKYLKQLFNAEYIKIKPVYKSIINHLLPFTDNSEKKYIIDINGQQKLNDIKLENMNPPYVGNN